MNPLAFAAPKVLKFIQEDAQKNSSSSLKGGFTGLQKSIFITKQFPHNLSPVTGNAFSTNKIRTHFIKLLTLVLAKIKDEQFNSKAFVIIQFADWARLFYEQQ